MGDETADEPIGIRDAVASLRAELALAMADARDEAVRFTIDKVVLEFAVEATRALEGGAGVRFWVVSAGGKAATSATTGHTVSIELTAQHFDRDDGAPTDIQIDDPSRVLPPIEE